MLSTLTMPVGILEATGHDPQRLGNAHASIAPYEVFEAQDGLIMICAGNDRLWRSLCDVIGRDDLAADPRFRTNADRVRATALLQQRAASRVCLLTVEALVTASRARSVPCGRVRSVAEAMADPQVAARDMLLTLDVPGLGAFRVLGNPSRCPACSQISPSAPPRLGEHTDAVLQSLGYTDK